MRQYYVYLYTDPRTGVIFYVGKGFGYRAKRHLCPSTLGPVGDRVRALRALGMTPGIAYLPCATAQHALEVEAALIAAYGRVQEGGPLVNRSPGGSNGFGGRTHRPETKERIRVAMKARVMTPEHKAKIKAKARLRTFSDKAKAARWPKREAARP